MPELFGSGTSSSAYSPKAVPVLFAIVTFTPTSGSTVGLTSVGEGAVVVNIDMVTNGGGTGGAIYFAPGSTSSWFWVANIGSSADSFSWRGMLPVSQITYNNASDTGGHFIVAGYRVPSS